MQVAIPLSFPAFLHQYHGFSLHVLKLGKGWPSPIPKKEQQEWICSSPHSPALKHTSQNEGGHPSVLPFLSYMNLSSSHSLGKEGGWPFPHLLQTGPDRCMTIWEASFCISNLASAGVWHGGHRT